MKLSDAFERIRREPKLLFFLAASGIVIGMALILISSKAVPHKDDINLQTTVEPQNVAVYAGELEDRLEDLIGAMEGAGRVKVMLTLESSAEQVFAEEVKRSGAGIYQDGYDGSTSESCVTVLEGENGDEAIIKKQLEPVIKGVAVVCQGGNEERVRERIVSSVSTVLGISSSRVSVAAMG